ncbi:hypothetical protein B0H10DRAFT_2255826 [Mycena sp. CBHHK59/15]|nr:hypothetical protein B0H10DRAFT_2255826 [Mycena sp. CBHHK59/15]
MSVADPSQYIPQLVVWSTFNIFAACSLIILVALTLVIQGSKANIILLNLEIIFILTSSTSSILIWTGHARDSHPPFGLCVFNAAVTMSNIPLMAGAALALVAKVWGTAMMIWHPCMRPTLMEWVVWVPLLVLLPFVSSTPLFFVGIGLGLKDQSRVFRGSPFYCVLDNSMLQTVSTALGAAFTLLALVLSAWTMINLFVTRRRVRTRRFTEDPNISFPFACRVILFSGFVGAAFVAGIVALSSTFSAVVPDIVVASCGVGAFFIFASATQIVELFLCRRNARRNLTSRTSPAPSSTLTMPSWRSGHGTNSGHPQESVMLSVVVAQSKVNSQRGIT